MFYGQHKQDEFLEKTVFKGFKKGFFVDVGAHDGISINNTLYFEKENGWTGINFEPLPHIYKRLVVNRPLCINMNCAVSTVEGTADFIHAEGYPEMISGLVSEYDPRHHQRLKAELNYSGTEKHIIKVNTRRLDKIFQEHGVKHIHLLSIDVEGAEFSVIKSLNYKNVFIDVIVFENNYDDVSIPIVVFLRQMGYEVIKKDNDIFMIHKDSQFVAK